MFVKGMLSLKLIEYRYIKRMLLRTKYFEMNKKVRVSLKSNQNQRGSSRRIKRHLSPQYIGTFLTQDFIKTSYKSIPKQNDHPSKLNRTKSNFQSNLQRYSFKDKNNRKSQPYHRNGLFKNLKGISKQTNIFNLYFKELATNRSAKQIVNITSDRKCGCQPEDCSELLSLKKLYGKLLREIGEKSQAIEDNKDKCRMIGRIYEGVGGGKYRMTDHEKPLRTDNENPLRTENICQEKNNQENLVETSQDQTNSKQLNQTQN